MIELSVSTVLLALLVVTLGTIVQATVGFGLALVAAPLLLLIDPVLVPAPLIMTAWSLSALIAWKERHHIVPGHIAIALYGRLLSSPPAALVIGMVSAAVFDLIFGLLVLAACFMSMLRPALRPTTRNLFIASMASGFMGTISGIGGPPIALVYQHYEGGALRANLALFFLVGCTISLAMLHLVGRFGWEELIYGCILQISVLAGYRISKPFRRMLDQRSVRPLLLGLCAASALLIVARALFGLF